PVRGGKLKLGTWQRVLLVECNGPRDREIVLTVTSV
ncbi:MAG TPA: YjbQ family protein, partial [Blastocatellia bacterium]